MSLSGLFLAAALVQVDGTKDAAAPKPTTVGSRTSTAGALGLTSGPSMGQPGLAPVTGARRSRSARAGKGGSTSTFQARPSPTLVAPRAPRARRAPAGAGAVDPKWALLDAGAGAEVESEFKKMLTESVSSPLSSDRAEELVQALTGVADAILQDGGLSLLARTRVGGEATDDELTGLWKGLAAAVPPDASEAARFVDDAALDAWFLLLDSSRDGAISFLEWRDRTHLPLALFRQVDASGEGLLDFDEFAPALLVSAARSESCEIDPGLIDWALEDAPDAAPAEAKDGMSVNGAIVSPTVILGAAALSDEEAIRRARAELAAAARYTQNSARLLKQKKDAAALAPKAPPVPAVPAADGSLPPDVAPAGPIAPPDPKARSRYAPTKMFRPRAPLPGG
jgi:hypothetical protein